MRRSLSILVALAALLLVACKEQTPSGILPKQQMIDVLTDYHLAQGIYEVQGGSEEYRYMLMQSAFRQHHITEAVFDSSMLWYSGKSEVLSEMYVQVGKRIEMMAAQSASSDVEVRSKYADLPKEGDTCNIWNLATHVNLLPTPVHNLYRFSLNADSTYLPGDKFVWYFRSQFHMQDGAREAFAQFMVAYEGDTVASHAITIQGDDEQELRVEPDKNLINVPVRSLMGFIYMPMQRGSTDFRLLMLRDMALVRMHNKEEEAEAESDSLQTDSAIVAPAQADSIHPVERRTPQEFRDAQEHEQRINVQKLRPVRAVQSRTTKRRMQ